MSREQEKFIPMTAKIEDNKPKPDENHIEVAVVTTSGRWPATGFDRVPTHQPVKVELADAARHLGIVNTSNWIARVGTKELNVAASYKDNGLATQVEIDYGPREAGGGI
jgi:hypothetical protein